MVIDDERGAGSGLGRRVGETSFGPVSVNTPLLGRGFGHSSLQVSLSPSLSSPASFCCILLG